MIENYLLGLGWMLVFAVIALGGYFGYKLIKKVDYDLDGYEVVLHQLSFILLAHMGSYYVKCEELSYYSTIIALFGFLALALYYIIRMIVRRKYISLKTILFYVGGSVLNIISVAFFVRGGWDGLYYILVLFGEILVLGYLLLVNLITLIIKCFKKDNSEKEIFAFNKKLKLLFMFISLIYPLIYGFMGYSLYNYIENSYRDASKEYVLDYLNKKYGEHEFRVVSVEETESCSGFSCEKIPYVYDVVVISEITDAFIITADIEEKEIETDEFMYKYVGYLTGEDIDSEYDIARYLEENYSKWVSDNILGEYEAFVKFATIEFDEEKLSEMNFINVKEVSDFYECLNAKKPTITVKKVFTEEELDQFNLYILEVYNKLEGLYEKDTDTNNIVNFKFNYKNPFATSTYYKSGGYIRETNFNYLIYTSAKPTEIIK